MSVVDAFLKLTLKNSSVEPALTTPYLISVCLAKSSTESIGLTMCSIVKKAARLAVYELISIMLKNHQALATKRPETDLKK